MAQSKVSEALHGPGTMMGIVRNDERGLRQRQCKSCDIVSCAFRIVSEWVGSGKVREISRLDLRCVQFMGI